MQKILTAAFFAVALTSSIVTLAQDDKSKRPSPPAKLSTTMNGASVTIDYSQPSVKGRTVGKEIAPYGQVWRTGANEATTFEVNKDVKIEGKDLKAGKYALFTIPGENQWVVIFNKQPAQWGAFKYDEKQDALRVTVKPAKAPSFTEKMTFVQNGNKVALLWGNTQVAFTVM